VRTVESSLCFSIKTIWCFFVLGLCSPQLMVILDLICGYCCLLGQFSVLLVLGFGIKLSFKEQKGLRQREIQDVSPICREALI